MKVRCRATTFQIDGGWGSCIFIPFGFIIKSSKVYKTEVRAIIALKRLAVKLNIELGREIT